MYFSPASESKQGSMLSMFDSPKSIFRQLQSNPHVTNKDFSLQVTFRKKLRTIFFTMPWSSSLIKVYKLVYIKTSNPCMLGKFALSPNNLHYLEKNPGILTSGQPKKSQRHLGLPIMFWVNYSLVQKHLKRM